MRLENLEVNIKTIVNNHRDKDLNLVLDIFMEFGASDYIKEGVQI